MPLLVFPCRKCGAPVDPGAKASLIGSARNVLMDCACAACGQRALYQVAESPITTR